MFAKTRLIVATKNQGKLRELTALLGALPLEILSLKDIGAVPHIKETGKTFRENALIKAKIISSATGNITLADDSGLIVPAMNGEPGVRSARYAGEEATDEENIKKLLKEAKNLSDSDRKARFECAIAVMKPTGETLIVTGEVEGILTKEPKGDGGFGYDPIFYLPALKKTMAEISEKEKSTISHRGKAMQKICERLPDFLNQ